MIHIRQRDMCNDAENQQHPEREEDLLPQIGDAKCIEHGLQHSNAISSTAVSERDVRDDTKNRRGYFLVAVGFSLRQAR